MKKHIITFTLLIVFLGILVSYEIFVKMPMDHEFAQWLENDYDTYDITCKDTNCNRIELKVPGEEKETIELHYDEGTVSPGIFVTYTDRTYRSPEKDAIFRLRVEGVWSGFTALTEELY
jgi:HSP20 family molecular chaperone IbpA